MGRRILLPLVPLLLSALFAPTPASAACAADPDALTFRQMILQGRTGVRHYPILMLGKVVATKDLGGDPGGRTIAKTAIAAHPVGWAPLVARIRFWRDPPGVGTEDNLEFHAGRLYGVVARHRDDGSFKGDGACGRTRRLGKNRFERLVALASDEAQA